MASEIKQLSDIPTLTHLYHSSKLQQPSSPSRQPSESFNSRVGLTNVDITKLRLDAIVNAANSSLLGGGGVDGAIHRAAGPELYDECSLLDGCLTGQAKITAGYELPAKHVIHTVGPVYSDSDPEDSQRLLRSCYRSCLAVAADHGVRTLAFSCISTGLYGYPSRDAAEVACETVRDYFQRHPASLERVVFVAFEDKDLTAYQTVLPIYFPRHTTNGDV
ncbi:macro domain-containing protein [Ophiocordyceps camponoti-floridani]|uniref:Macro domain-containing protein n=1 Tax=Ophiocordyceps camponoti-floridani TaxID=2030778 RepID=A0A8H4Q3P4_9HYPO|nr:macro domain-containing protein [Ophiocordyceps camponoti-floridani]